MIDIDISLIDGRGISCLDISWMGWFDRDGHRSDGGEYENNFDRDKFDDGDGGDGKQGGGGGFGIATKAQEPHTLAHWLNIPKEVGKNIQV